MRVFSAMVAQGTRSAGRLTRHVLRPGLTTVCVRGDAGLIYRAFKPVYWSPSSRYCVLFRRAHCLHLRCPSCTRLLVSLCAPIPPGRHWRRPSSSTWTTTRATRSTCKSPSTVWVSGAAVCPARPPATNLMSPCAVPCADHAGYRVSALVWTTTPWTLPANQVGRHPTSPR